MELNKCMGCMEDIVEYPCSKCGFDPRQTGNAEYALPVETILAGKYLVGKVLGQGGFGITYIGWDLALERKVAIKEYYPSGQVSRQPGTRQLTWYTGENARAAQQSGMEMFLKEARKMVRVDAISGVVRVLDLFRENETAYIVMDFVEGETLKSRLKQTGPMSWEQAKEIFRPAIQTMEKVHRAGLVHRDISPDNLMLIPEGKVNILDLGAAKDLNVNTGASSMQVAKSGFSPFEQYSQRGGSGPWTDVYSMAATIYYALTGKLLPIAIDRVEEDTIDWAQPRLDTLPPEALEALKKALAVSVKQRTQSMEELEKGLFGASKQITEPIPQVKAEQEPQTKADIESETVQKEEKTKKSNKNRWGITACAVVALCLLLFIPGRRSEKQESKVQEERIQVQTEPQPTIQGTETEPTQPETIPQVVPPQTLSPTIEEMLGAKGLTMSDTFYALSDMVKYTFGYLAVKEEANGDFVIVNICSTETQVQQIMYQYYFPVAGMSEAQKSERKKEAQNQLKQFTHCATDKKTIAETDAFLSSQVLLDVLPQEYADLEEMGLLVLKGGQADIMETMAHLEKNGWTIRAFQLYPYNELPVEYCWLMDRWGINVTQLDMCVADHTIWALKELDTERPQQVMAVEDAGKIQFMAFRYFVPIDGLTEEQRSARIKTETDAARAALAELGKSGEASFILFRHHACIVQLIRNVDDPSVQKFLLETGMVDDAGAFTTAGLLESLSRDYLVAML